MRAHIWIGRIKRIVRTIRVRWIEGIVGTSGIKTAGQVILSEQLGHPKRICRIGSLGPVRVIEAHIQIIGLHTMYVLPVHSEVSIVDIALHVDHLGDLPSSIPRIHLHGQSPDRSHGYRINPLLVKYFSASFKSTHPVLKTEWIH